MSKTLFIICDNSLSSKTAQNILKKIDNSDNYVFASKQKNVSSVEQIQDATVKDFIKTGWVFEGEWETPATNLLGYTFYNSDGKGSYLEYLNSKNACRFAIKDMAKMDKIVTFQMDEPKTNSKITQTKNCSSLYELCKMIGHKMTFEEALVDAFETSEMKGVYELIEKYGFSPDDSIIENAISKVIADSLAYKGIDKNELESAKSYPDEKKGDFIVLNIGEKNTEPYIYRRYETIQKEGILFVIDENKYNYSGREKIVEQLKDKFGGEIEYKNGYCSLKFENSNRINKNEFETKVKEFVKQIEPLEKDFEKPNENIDDDDDDYDEEEAYYRDSYLYNR